MSLVFSMNIYIYIIPGRFASFVSDGICMCISGAYQSSQGNLSENDPNNTTVSTFSEKKNKLGISVTLSSIILQ